MILPMDSLIFVRVQLSWYSDSLYNQIFYIARLSEKFVRKELKQIDPMAGSCGAATITSWAGQPSPQDVHELNEKLQTCDDALLNCSSLLDKPSMLRTQESLPSSAVQRLPHIFTRIASSPLRCLWEAMNKLLTCLRICLRICLVLSF